MNKDDKRLSLRVQRDTWNKACVNSKLRGYRSLQEYLRFCIVKLNDEAMEIEKSKAVLEATRRG